MRGNNRERGKQGDEKGYLSRREDLREREEVRRVEKGCNERKRGECVR